MGILSAEKTLVINREVFYNSSIDYKVIHKAAYIIFPYYVEEGDARL